MGVWEFALVLDDGTIVGQTALGEGADEASAARSAARALAEHPHVGLQRPGRAAAADVEARWREICGDGFPTVMSDAGRLARYARGLPLGTEPAPAPRRAWWRRLLGRGFPT